MQTLKKIPGKALESETIRGSFYINTVEQPNPGFNKMEILIDVMLEIVKKNQLLLLPAFLNDHLVYVKNTIKNQRKKVNLNILLIFVLWIKLAL